MHKQLCNRAIRAAVTGFSLLELMVGISVLGILLAIGVPSFVEMTASNRVTTQANELVTALNYARSEAVKRGEAVSVCSSTNGSACAGSNTWSTGWIVFTDATGTAGTLDASDVLLQIWSSTGGLALGANGPSVRYQASGMVANSRDFALQKSPCSGPKAREISIAATGRVSTLKADCT